MNESLSRIVADLFAKARGGEDLSSEINRVRDEIKKVIESEDTAYGKFRGLVESFQEVIPEEKQRYRAAVKALSTTSKLSPGEIVAAVDNQLEELKILEKVLIPGRPGLPDELKAMQAAAQEMRNEISRLREKTAQLEKEEKEIADRMAGREKEMAVVEKEMREVFRDIGAEITSIKKRVEEFSAESAAARPAPDADTVTSDVPGGKRQGSGQKSVTDQISSHNDTEPRKTCPLCGGRMDYYIAEKKWQCFSCAYEESEKDGVQGKKGEPGAQSIFPEPGEHPDAPGPDEQKVLPGPAPDSDRKQKCPMCGGRMDYYIADGKWQCYSCGFENLEKDTGQGKSEEKSTNTEHIQTVPVSDLLFDRPSATRSKNIKKKACPACAGKMLWHESDNAWQCPDCGYEPRI